MAKLTTLLAATALAAAASSPAFACSWGKTAKTDTMTMAHVTAPTEKPVVEEAMTTFDPAEKPVFEAVEPTVETVEEPVSE